MALRAGFSADLIIGFMVLRQNPGQNELHERDI